MRKFDPTTLEIYRALYTSVAEEMGIALRRTAFSPNIKERRDYSCAVFDRQGRVIAQGDHMPVHLGSMPLAVAAALQEIQLEPGDVVALNDPYAGGTHLPDVTLVSGVFFERGKGEKRRGERGKGRKGETPNLRTKKLRTENFIHASPFPLFPHSPFPLFYVANRAHHADIGGATPGSMGLATDIYGEGLRIPPIRLVRSGELDLDTMRLVLANVRGRHEREGDFRAQIGSLKTGARRLLEVVKRRGAKEATDYAAHLIAYSARLMRATIESIPDGVYHAADELDDDGITEAPVPRVCG
jgi:N-methylhydantoinase B